MPQATVEAIAAVTALIAFGSFSLLGMRMWLNAKTERLRHQAGGDADRVAESLTDLQDQLHAAREEIAELQERVDFTERVLSRGPQGHQVAPPREVPPETE